MIPNPAPPPAAPLGRCYDGASVTFRLLRALGWGPQLLNLGYFVARGPLNWVNLLPSRFRLAAAQQRLVRRTLARLGAARGDRVLEVACGRGYASFHLAQALPGVEVTGLDLLGENVAVARTLYGHARGLRYAEGDAQALPFPSASFDKVFCLEAAFHFPERARFLAEAARVLKPGGRLAVVDFMWRDDAARKTARGDERLRIVQETWGFDDFWTEAEYRAAAEAAGLRVVARWDWSGAVTRPLQGQFDALARAAGRRSGRWLMTRYHELLRSFSRNDWSEAQLAAAAHRFVHRHSRYAGLLLEKGGG